MEFEELHDNDYIAFLQLEAEFRKDFESATENQNVDFTYYAIDYMNLTLAAAQEIGIAELAHLEVPFRKDDIGRSFNEFRRDVDALKVRFRIRHTRAVKEMSVGLSPEQKTKIHELIERIRSSIEESNASKEKKEKLFAILSSLSKEVSKARTGFERIGDLARSLVGFSREAAEDGAEPWWKWFKAILGTIDDAKEEEPRLPAPKEVKKLEPPKKELPKPTDLDDDIPF